MAKKEKTEREKFKEEIKKDLKKEFRLKKRRPLLFRFIKTIIRLIMITIIVLIISLTLVAAGTFLVYNFIPLKTIAYCISNETQVSPIKCSFDNDCIKRVNEIIEISGETVSEVTETEEGIEKGVSFIKNFLEFIFKEIGSCNKDSFCEIKKVRGLEQIIGKEAVECTSNEERREIKITLKTIIPPYKIIEIIKKTIKSEEIRNTLIEIIKTRKLPNL